MSIQGDIIELENLKKELRVLNLRISECRKQKNTVEERIIKFMKEQDTPGLKYNDNAAIILESKTVRNRKKKDEKIKDTMNILGKHGYKNIDQKAIMEILEAQKGVRSTNDSLKMIQK